MANNPNATANLKPFTKGDKRINRRGRITNFAKLRKLAQEVGNEVIDESEAITRFTALLRVMSSSRNPADRMGFLAYAVGKPKDEVDMTSNGEVTIRVIREEAKKNDAA